MRHEDGYITSLDGIGGADRFAIGEMVKISPFASLMCGESAVILGASLQCAGRVCVRGEGGILGHYTPTMLEVKP